MLIKLLCFFWILSDFVGSSVELNVYINVNVSNFDTNNECVYLQELEVPRKSYNTFNINGLEQNYKKLFGYAVFQLHCFHYNVTLSKDEILNRTSHENGTNLGLVLFSQKNTQTLHVWNNNYDEVQCLVALIIYNINAPLVGGCNFEYPLEIKPTSDVQLTDDYVIISMPLSKYAVENMSIKCGDNSAKRLSYYTYFLYLDQNNLQSNVYFNGVRSLLFGNISNYGYKSKNVMSPFRRFYEKVEGTGIIFNTIVIDEDGNTALYVPSHSYSCPYSKWGKYCSEISPLRRSFAILVILIAVILMVNLVLPTLMDGVLSGMLFGGFGTMIYLKSYTFDFTNVEIFLLTAFGGFLISTLIATISSYIKMGFYMTRLLFSIILLTYFMELYFDDVSSIPIQLALAFAFSILLVFVQITFSVILGGLILIIGLSQLLKVGNLHRPLINNFHIFTTSYALSNDDNITSFMDILRPNFINYKITLNAVDYSLLLLYLLVTVILTIRKERIFENNTRMLRSRKIFFARNESVDEFNRLNGRKRRQRQLLGSTGTTHNEVKIVSRCRRHHFRSNVLNERSPLIAGWLSSSDDECDEVFISPQSNSRYMSQLSPASADRISAIQKFDI